MSPGPETGDHGWVVACTRYDPADEGRREAVLALGNGLFVVRAATAHLQSPARYAGTYRAGGYDPVLGLIEGERDESETLVNLPDWLPLDLRIGGEHEPWMRLDGSGLLDYRHQLDLRRGTALRDFTWRDASGRTTRVREQRLVSMAQPHLCSLRLEVTPLDWSGPLGVRSGLVGGVVNDNVPRYADYQRVHLQVEAVRSLAPGAAMLQARTAGGGLAVATAVRTRIEATTASWQECRQGADIGHTTQLQAQAGRTLAIEKVAAIVTSLDPGVADPGETAQSLLAHAPDHGALQAEHERAWADLWSVAAIDAADPALCRSLRLHAFHLLQTLSPHSAALDIGVPARGWHGEGYRGHVFWDQSFVLPFLQLRLPEVARACLHYRHRRLDAARARARAAGRTGAMFPWRSASSGEEVTPKFQKNMLDGRWLRDDTTLQRHVGGAIALDVWRYYLATGDLDFLCARGAEMVLEIARFWAGLAQPECEDERFGIRGVVGPDEYHTAYPGADAPGLDNNAYTNLIAVWTLCCAFDVLAELPPDRRRELEQRLALGPAEYAHWERVSCRMVVPFHGDGILSQFEGFDRLEAFDRSILPPKLADQRLDWALQASGRDVNAFQLTKQADVLTLFHLLPERTAYALLHRLGYPFDRGDLLRTAAYYMARTSHRSSLSRVVYAGALAQADPDRSWAFYQEALGTDLHVLEGESVAEGVHLAAMGGTLDVLQRRYLGLEPEPGGLRVEPALPRALGPVRLSLRYRGQRLQARAEGGHVLLRSASSNRTALAVLGPADEARWLEPGRDLVCCSSADRKPDLATDGAPHLPT